MRGIDLETFRFDYDLTFCSLLMHADGTTYHVYGGRDWRDAQSHLSLRSLIRVLGDTLVEHATYAKQSKRRRPPKPRYIDDSPALKKRLAEGKRPECIHCHSVHDFEREDARAAKRWRRSEIWIFPDLEQVGFTVERDDQAVVARVLPDSPAAAMGLAPGDRLHSFGPKYARTYGDLQMVLHDAKASATRVRVEWTRGTERMSGTLALKKGWKERTPEVFAWRPSKWPLSPKPGFGGPPLSRTQKEKRGLDPDAFAFRVQYIVTWGPSKHTGRNAAKAGIRKGDIVYSVCGKTDFRDMNHFHAWFRLTREVGTTCEIKLLRGDAHKTVTLPVIE